MTCCAASSLAAAAGVMASTTTERIGGRCSNGRHGDRLGRPLGLQERGVTGCIGSPRCRAALAAIASLTS